MEKRFIDRRLNQMEAEGTVFKTGVEIGKDISYQEIQDKNDAVVIAIGSTNWRDLPIPGRDLEGIHQAMEFLVPANKVQDGDLEVHPFSASGKNVIIIGGGDTGADCLGTALRHGAASVKQFEIMPRPPDSRDSSTPWPTWPLMMRTSSAHEEGGDRLYSINTKQFLGQQGKVSGLETISVKQEIKDGRMEFIEIPDTTEIHEADLVCLAMGFIGPEINSLVEESNVELNERGNIQRDHNWMSSVKGIFVAGDAGRGQSLIVWAIAEGRSCAASVDSWLQGGSQLPDPVSPDFQQLR